MELFQIFFCSFCLDIPAYLLGVLDTLAIIKDKKI